MHENGRGDITGYGGIFWVKGGYSGLKAGFSRLRGHVPFSREGACSARISEVTRAKSSGPNCERMMEGAGSKEWPANGSGRVSLAVNLTQISS